MKQTMGEHPPEAQKARVNGSAQHRVHSDLKAYLDGELSGPFRWLTERHVARCASCRDEMRRLEHLGRQVQMLDQALPGSHLRARILASLPAAPPANAPAVSRLQPADARSLAALSRRPLGVAMGLCALLLMVGAFALARYGRAGAAAGNPAFTPAQNVTSDAPTVRVTPLAANPGSVQEPAVASLQPVSPARTQPDPFAPDTIAQAASREASGADTGAAQHSTPTGAEDMNSGETSETAANAQPAYTDPTSAAADRLAAAIIPDKLREKRQMADAAPTSASAHSSIPIDKTTASAPMRVAVAVADVSEASRQVRRWADQAGAQVTVLPSKTIKTAERVQSPDGTSGASADPAAVLSAAQTATVLRLQVPLQRAAGFEAYLSHMGRPTGAASHAKGEEINGVHDLKTDALITRPYPMPARVLDGEPVTPSKHSATVTIFVRLESGTSAPRP